MSTLHKVKAYFGMAPMDDYDDEYYDDDDRGAEKGEDQLQRLRHGFKHRSRPRCIVRSSM